MNIFYALIFAVILSLMTSGLIILLLRFLHHNWWKRKTVRYATVLMATAGLISLTVWVIGIFNDLPIISFIGGLLGWGIFLLQLSLIVSLPLSGLVHIAAKIAVYFENRKKNIKDGPQIERRLFLKNAAAVFPARLETKQA